MSVFSPARDAPRIVHSLPGRIRVHVPRWRGADLTALERRLTSVTGVRRARASAQTQNVLVEFDPDLIDSDSILVAMRKLQPAARGARRGEGFRRRRAEDSSGSGAARGESGTGSDQAPSPREHREPHRRARIAVRGIDRDPELARRVVERLGRLPGISQVSASQLTGRVLVEYSEHLLDVEDLLGQVSNLELPELPGEDTPSHPLDPAPLIQSTARVVGSALGLGLIALRRATSGTDAPAGSGPGAGVAGAIGIIEGLPPVERRLEDLLGRNGAQLALSGMTIVGLSFAGSPLGLAVAGAGALRLMTTVRARRNTWRRYEERVSGAETAVPGCQVEIEPGERLPLAGTVLSGFGTAISASGEVVQAAPGERLDAGTRLSGGPVTVVLEAEPAFTPARRPTPPTPTVYDRYLSALPPISLAYAALSALLTRSPARALTALLLVNPRAAIIGAESADNGAAARVLRQGATVVGSRERRAITRPDALLLDSPRVVANGLSVHGVSAGHLDYNEAAVLALAAGVSAAAGSPWGPIFEREDAAEAVDGTFDGRGASAEIKGERWLLTPARQRRDPAERAACHVLEL
ncbi:MAG: hypothetical protein JO179_11470, partial [Solirubrobacterales bacterium]|nr:hypothetical protein [Solirubrobacterales bacterium]